MPDKPAPPGPSDAPMDAPSVQTLWLLAVRDHRDRAAFGQLFDFYAPRIKSMLMRGGMSAAAAEDVVQDAMIKVWQRAEQFDATRAPASAWIYRIARNRQIEVLRRERRPLPDDLIAEAEATDPDAADIIGLQQDADHLRAALHRLPQDQRAMIEQAFLGELTHSEIRDATGLALGTIKSRIRLALERLRHDLRTLR